MTNSIHAITKGVIWPSRNPRIAGTVALRQLMEEQQRLEMAARIRGLRERSPFTQPQIAKQLHIGLRGYQKLEKVGTQSYERCEELVAIHSAWTADAEGWEHVDADWIWDGKDRSQTPDPFAATSRASGTDVARLEEGIGQLVEQVAGLSGELAQVAATQEQLLRLLLPTEQHERAPGS